ncbi:MAG: fucose isomerase [Candidatus Hodarchaeota archaeon]
MSIKIIPFFSPLSSKEIREKIISELFLEKVQIISSEDFLSNKEANIQIGYNYIFVGTGGTENDIANFVEQVNLNQPIILLSYDSNNSLPAAMETRNFLNNQKIDAMIVHGSLTELATTIQEWCYFIDIQEKLKNCQIGIVGNPSDWLIASDIDEHAIERIWGTKIIKIPIEQILEYSNTELGENIKAAKEKFIENSINMEVTEEEIHHASLIAGKLIEIAQEYNTDALTVECFTLLTKTNITSCFALSYLNSQGTAGCEGDIPSVFTMLLLRLLIGKPSFMANVVHVNVERNSINLAHCTIPLQMLEKYSITSHFESKKSVAIRGKFQTPQEVTILKIAGKDLTKWWVTEGKILKNLNNPSACRTQIEIVIDNPIDYFLKNSLANHHILILGRHKHKIQEFIKFVLKEEIN